MEKKFKLPHNAQDVMKLMDKQKMKFDSSKKALAVDGIDLMEDRTIRYLQRWKEALVNVNKSANVLDVGSGWLAEPIFDLIINDYNLNYHAIDIDPHIINEMQQRMASVGRPNENFHVGEISYFPFEKKFDMVFSSHCLEHALDIVETLVEIRKVLKDEGILFMSVPLGFDLSDEHLLYLGPDEWTCLLRHMGFEIVSTTLSSVYVSEMDLTIVARQFDKQPSDINQARILVSKFVKADSTFIHSNSASFRYAEDVDYTTDSAIVRQIGSRVCLNVPGKPKSLIVVRHPWSGTIIISDKYRRLSLDCFSPFHHRYAVCLAGFLPEIEIEIDGKNELSKGNEMVICGALYDPPMSG